MASCSRTIPIDETEPLHRTGNLEEDLEGVSSDAATVRPQGHQESSAVLWTEMETMQVSFPSLVSPFAVTYTPNLFDSKYESDNRDLSPRAPGSPRRMARRSRRGRRCRRITGE